MYDNLFSVSECKVIFQDLEALRVNGSWETPQWAYKICRRFNLAPYDLAFAQSMGYRICAFMFLKELEKVSGSSKDN